MSATHDDAKKLVRTQVWNALDAADAVHDDTAHGRIPNFKGSEEAAARLAGLEAWKNATVIKAVPDKAQLPVRAGTLEDGKLLYMAVPKLATPKPFYLLDPAVGPRLSHRMRPRAVASRQRSHRRSKSMPCVPSAWWFSAAWG